MTKYVRNEEGGVHSVTDEHFDTVLHETSASGNQYLMHGWEEIDEATARAEHPQLFGAPDPEIVYTAVELEQIEKRAEYADKVAARIAAHAAPEPAPEPAAAKK